ncbi:unnamed protein product [marine sediment metagenome]|uniref:Uncharacterized protein n=1 Tax=marine sediment metagenome TaxID=412755 RepID=X0ZZ80_9ZZZZ
MQSSLSLRLFVLLSLTALVSGCGQQRPAAEKVTPADVDRDRDPAWHMARIRAGDFRTAGRRSWSHGEPFHVWMLIELDYVAVPQLLGALRDDTPTREDYIGRFGWTGGAVFGDAPVRIATIGDIADYVLRQIYSTDVGYASYLSKKDREIAIQKWRTVIYGGDSSQHPIGP